MYVEGDLVAGIDIRLPWLDDWRGIEEDVQQGLVVHFVDQIIDAHVVELVLRKKDRNAIIFTSLMAHLSRHLPANSPAAR